jgi:hypothetical protein
MPLAPRSLPTRIDVSRASAKCHALALRLGRFSFESFPISNALSFIAHDHDVMMVVCLHVPDVDTGEMSSVDQCFSLSEYVFGAVTDEELKTYVRYKIFKALQHEIDEHLRFDRKLVNDPHKGGR